MDTMTDVLDREILPYVKKPIRYTNAELGSVHKEWDAVAVRMALCFPELYEIGMSNLGIQALYHVVNARQDLLCERVFSVDMDMEKLMRDKHVPLFSLESRHPLMDFDLLGISLQHELTYTNFITMLQLGHVPLHAKDRKGTDPYVFIGGHGAFNPAAVSDFIDFAVIGEGEEVLVEVLEYFKTHRDAPRAEFLAGLAGAVPGVYVPALDNATTKRYIQDLDVLTYPPRPIVPFLETVHDRLTVEVMRGCSRACRFCQAGYALLPRREVSMAKILGRIEHDLPRTGYDEVSLVSLSSGDHSCIEPLLLELLSRYRDRKVNISLPSLRIDSLSPELVAATQATRHSSLTLAPEAGSQRLRDVLNKRITEEEIMKAIEHAVANRTNSIKLYFMIGLPTETREDIEAIALLADKIKPILRKNPRAKCTINVSNFIPKPHTPLQWARQNSVDELYEKQDHLKRIVHGKQISVKCHTPELSFLEGIFSRGDAALGRVLEKAVELGARFDGWDEHFKPELWKEAFIQAGVDPMYYLRERQLDEQLPWASIKTGVSVDNLKNEYLKALAQ